MTNAPAPGWYQDPELAGRLRYWDGNQWTEHLAAAQNASPTYPVASGFYQPSGQHVTLFNNPYQLPPRTSRRSIENALSTNERVQAAAIDAAMIIPFVVIGLWLAPVLAWVSGDGTAKGHAYHGAALVLALVLGIGFVFWNFVIREITLGTEVLARRKKPIANPEDTPPTADGA